MLRAIALALLLANAGYFAFTHGWLARWGWAPEQQSEPQRLDQQLRPEVLRLLPPTGGPRAQPTPAPAPGPETTAAVTGGAGECLQAGVFDALQAARLRDQLTGLALPAGSYAFEPVTVPGRWIVYMGRYADAEQVARKKAELRYRKVSFEALQNSSLEPGLSLGGFATQAEAARELEALANRGVRTARVLQERGEVQGQTLRLPAVDDTLRPRLDAVRPLLGSKPLRPCG